MRMFQSVWRHGSEQSVSPTLYQTDLKIANHRRKTKRSSVANAPFIQNSNQMASSVHRNHKISKGIFSTPAIFKGMSKLFGCQRCSDDKN